MIKENYLLHGAWETPLARVGNSSGMLYNCKGDTTILEPVKVSNVM